jgi:hypothetical protein
VVALNLSLSGINISSRLKLCKNRPKEQSGTISVSTSSERIELPVLKSLPRRFAPPALDRKTSALDPGNRDKIPERLYAGKGPGNVLAIANLTNPIRLPLLLFPVHSNPRYPWTSLQK